MSRDRPQRPKARLNCTASWPTSDSRIACGSQARDLVEQLGIVLDAERQVAVGDDLAAQLAHVSRRQAMRDARPDVVVADEHPAPRRVAAGEVLDRRTQLLAGRLAEREHAGRALAALVERRVDVRDLARDVLQHALAHLARVHADDGVDRAGVHELGGDAADLGRPRRTNRSRAGAAGDRAGRRRR